MSDSDPRNWNTLDYVGVVFSSILGLALAAGFGYALYNPTSRAAITSTLGAFFFAIVNFIPFGFITFGFIADIIGQDFRYSIASIVGLIAIVVNFFIALITGKSVIMEVPGQERPGPAWCMIPGLEKFENKRMPMSIVSAWAVLSYYIIFAGTKRNTVQNISIYSSIGLLAITQLATFYGSDCSMYYEDSSTWRVISLLLGIGIGASGWAVVSTFYPSQSPFVDVRQSANTENFIGREHMLSGKGWDGSVQSPTFQKLVPRTGAQCSKDQSEEGDEFICEAYKNGKLVTEKINA
jgi:MFS family permease